MPLKAKIANKIVADDKGYTTGEIIDINEIDEHSEKEGKKEVTYASQFEFLIAVDGTKKQTLLRFWTGQNINSEKFENEGDDTTDYNRLTRFLLNMGLLDAKKLSELDKAKIDDSEIDLEALRGQKIQFKMNKSIKRKGLSVIDIKSIKPVEVIESIEPVKPVK
ncbi:hypothetical protein QUA07_27925 [Microcoleus sp. T3_A4]|uniref:hypothetical protein n=1 Tax=Microcoleus sp. T3_A4 TaxID=2818968 RepID=UPI002FD1B90E